jgi:hypothetical protein
MELVTKNKQKIGTYATLDVNTSNEDETNEKDKESITEGCGSRK